MIDPLIPQSDHVAAWIDRTGNMVFIGDEHDYSTMQPRYFQAACQDHDLHRTEAAVWWS